MLGDRDTILVPVVEGLTSAFTSFESVTMVGAVGGDVGEF